MARARKPLEQQKGDLTEQKTEERKLQEQSVRTGKEALEHPPDWLSDRIAEDEFKRVVAELTKIDIIGNLDLANIGAYANAYSGYVRATKDLKGKSMIITRTTSKGIVKGKNPLIGVQEDYAKEMRKFGNLCGITIDSRLKAAESRAAQIEEELEEKFGNI